MPAASVAPQVLHGWQGNRSTNHPLAEPSPAPSMSNDCRKPAGNKCQAGLGSLLACGHQEGNPTWGHRCARIESMIRLSCWVCMHSMSYRSYLPMVSPYTEFQTLNPHRTCIRWTDGKMECGMQEQPCVHEVISLLF